MEPLKTGAMGCVASAVACCFGSAACTLCCSACGSCNNSVVTRVAYALVLLFGVAVSCVMLAPGLADQLAKIPYLCSGITHCRNLVGYLAVYRVCFAMAAFFFLFSVLTINVKSSRDPRSAIQNGFWFFKILILVGISIGTFFITGTAFPRAMMIIGMIGAFLFILIQLVLLVDFAHSWNEKWLERYENSGSRLWLAGLLFFTTFFYLLSLGAIIAFYILYANHSECGLHKFFISFNLILCVAVSIVSILPQIQEVNSRSGLLQSSVVTAYTMFLTWLAMTNNPDSLCNPSIEEIMHGGSFSNSTNPGDVNTVARVDGKSVVSLIVFLVCVLYASVQSSSRASVGRMTSSSSERTTLTSDTADNGGHVADDEEDGVTYSYSLFHCMLLLASFFTMMTLTHWYRPSSDFTHMNANLPAMWVKVSSSWVCLLLYFWTLVAPVVLGDRDFN